MPYIRPYTPAEFRALAGQLVSVYQDGERAIVDILAQGSLSEWRQAFLREQLRQIHEIVLGLNQANAEWAGVHIPTIYAHNVELTAQALGIDPGMMAVGQQEIAILQHSLVTGLDYATGGVGRGVKDVYRQAVLERTQQGLIGGKTGDEVSRQVIADLTEKGIPSFVDKSGNEWGLSRYADMATRTACAETDRQGTFDAMADLNRDLVQVSTHDEPCKLCEPWQGEILSISGDSQDYASVAEAENAGLMHPSCLHSYEAWG